MKIKKFKENLTASNLRQHTEFLKEMKSDFKLEASNYTAKITTNTTQITFTMKSLELCAFIAHGKIKNDLKKFTANEIPIIETGLLEYYNQNLRSEILQNVLNFDLTKAYPTILYKDGFISIDTFNYLCKINKDNRLAAIGMLARKKNITIFQDGKPILIDIEKKETSNYFFYCVKKTHQIIMEIKEALNLRFLFSWVDGIYFEIIDLKNLNLYIELVKQVCDKYEMNFTTEILSNYFATFENDFYKVIYSKDNNDKVFSIPSNELNLNYRTYKRLNAENIKLKNKNNKL